MYTPRKTKSGGGGVGGGGGTSYLARPKLGALKNIYSGRSLTRPTSSYGPDKRKKVRKPSLTKMEFKKKPDYADTAYREAVSRLRILLAESYIPVKRPLRELDSAGEETDNQSVISAGSRTSRIAHGHYHSSVIPRRYNYYTTPTRSTVNVSPEKPLTEPPSSKWENEGAHAPPELMSFIERQEEYIEQLEKESRFSRDELSGLLGKVKDVISENENLHERQKANLIKSVFDHLETETETEETEIEVGRSSSKSPRRIRKPARILEGPTIVFESRISELEAQLTQTKIDLKKAQEDNETYRRKMADGVFGDGTDSVKKQMETLQREKLVLQDTVDKLQGALSVLRDKENNTCDQVKRSLDVAEQAQYEKSTAELEIRRLKDELERQHGKLRDAISEQSRRIADERSAVERRYSQQIEQLTAELGVQWEQTNKFQLELDKQRRENADLRREIAQKQAQIDDLKKDMHSKISGTSSFPASLQSDIGLNGAEKSSLEQQIATLQLANERQERQARQESSRQHAEMQSLRQRLDRADADLIHSRRENIRLNEQIAALEKELKMNEALADERSKRGGSGGGEIIALPPPKEGGREKELSSMIKGMEEKHVATVAELEGMIFSQNQLMDKLSNECHVLTQKLEEASTRHKEEIRELQTNLGYLTSRFTLPANASVDKVSDEGRRPLANTSESAPIESPVRKETPRAPNSQLSRTNSNASSVLPRPQKTDPPKKLEEAESKPDRRRYAPDEQYSKVPSEGPPLRQYDPNEQYANVPSEQDVNYGGDPNQQYAGEPNETYGVDPNQQYPQDPNQQYSDQPYEEQYMTEEEYQQQYGQYDDPNVQYNNQQYPTEAYQMDPQYASDPNQYPDDRQTYPSPTPEAQQQYAATPSAQQAAHSKIAPDQKAVEEEYSGQQRGGKTVEKINPERTSESLKD